MPLKRQPRRRLERLPPSVASAAHHGGSLGLWGLQMKSSWLDLIRECHQILSVALAGVVTL